MGAIELSSPLYSIGARDEYFGWKGLDHTTHKEVGLRRMMDVSLCIAVPPYSYLLGGKLMAMLATTDFVAAEFRRRYDDPLLAVTTTCASGLHCPIFNRLRTQPGGLYRRIGQTSGYGTIIFSEQTVCAAVDLVRALSQGPIRKWWKTIPILRKALSACAITPPDLLLRMGVGKGVYVAELLTGARVALRDMREPARGETRLSVERAVSVWLGMLQARAQLQDSICAMRRYKVADLPLSLLLKGREP